jgi:hypothetical protein
MGGAPANGGTAAGGATAGSNSTGGSGTGGSAPVGNGSCRGPYGQAVPVLLEDTGFSINGISVTADERELYYARAETSMPRVVVRRTRASTADVFGPVEPLPVLAGVCGDTQRANPDISEDGLTLYITCTEETPAGMSEGVSPLRVARRASRSSDFVLEAEPIGGVFAAAGISADELTAYTDGEFFDTAPQMFTRATKAESFSGPIAVPGITKLRSPDISSDGLALFGAASVDNMTQIVRAVRDSEGASFSEPAPLGLQTMPAAIAMGAPNVSAGCALYVVVVLMSGEQTVYRAPPQ